MTREGNVRRSTKLYKEIRKLDTLHERVADGSLSAPITLYVLNQNSHSDVILDIDGSCLGSPIRNGYGGILRNDVGFYFILSPSYNTWPIWLYYAYQCIILSLNILNNISEKIMKIWYFENTLRDESNDILYDTIYFCVLVEKYGQSKLDQNSRFSNVSTIAGRREYEFSWYLHNSSDILYAEFYAIYQGLSLTKKKGYCQSYLVL